MGIDMSAQMEQWLDEQYACAVHNGNDPCRFHSHLHIDFGNQFNLPAESAKVLVREWYNDLGD